MPKTKWKSRTKYELIIEIWEDLHCESVGALELKQIQLGLSERFGAGAVESPAAIARVVADEGAVLRHPEVLDYDTKWRERSISGAIPMDSLEFSSLAAATESIRKLESWRRKFAAGGEQTELRRLREIARKFKQDAQMLARSSIIEEQERLEAGEIAQWLAVWLQEPSIFEDWLMLRKRSPEFTQKLKD
jgi:hypothetical protein